MFFYIDISGDVKESYLNDDGFKVSSIKPNYLDPIIWQNNYNSIWKSFSWTGEYMNNEIQSATYFLEKSGLDYPNSKDVENWRGNMTVIYKYTWDDTVNFPGANIITNDLPNKTKKIKIKKTDKDSNLLEGASLKVTDTSNNLIEDWKSTAEDHAVEIYEDIEYILKETESPAGYDIAKDIHFKIKDNKIYIKNQEKWEESNLDYIQMVDRVFVNPKTGKGILCIFVLTLVIIGSIKLYKNKYN